MYNTPLNIKYCYSTAFIIIAYTGSSFSQPFCVLFLKHVAGTIFQVGQDHWIAQVEM